MWNGKKFLFLLIAVFLLILFLVAHGGGIALVWKLWGVPAMPTLFADLQSVTSGVESQRAGFDPLYLNPNDPYGRPMAYPRLWLAIGLLGVHFEDTFFLGLVMLGLYLVGIFIFSKRLTWQDSLAILAVVISPAAMLAYERGNNDLLIFFLLALVLLLDERASGISFGLLELAAFLKFYPLAGLTYLLKLNKKTFLLWLMMGIGVFGIYAFLTRHDMYQVFSSAPKGTFLSYGVQVPGMIMIELYNLRTMGNILSCFLYLLCYFLVVSILFLSSRDNAYQVETLQNLDAFRLSASIYIATFIQGDTFNYRLVFLIFGIPQLVKWMNHPSSRKVAGVTFGFLVFTCWNALLFGVMISHPGIWTNLFLFLIELGNWGLFAGMLYLMCATLPEWIRDEIHLFAQKYPHFPGRVRTRAHSDGSRS